MRTLRLGFACAVLGIAAVSTGAQESVAPAGLVGTWKLVSYFGTYSVDMKRKVVIHRVEADLADVFTGENQERPFELAGDRLTLTPRWTVDDKHWSGVRVFERVK